MSAKRNNIRIHPDHVEHLDQTRAEARKHAIKPERTGYESVCQLVNEEKKTLTSLLFGYREFRFKAKFVKEKMKSGVFITFAPFDSKQAERAENETGDEQHRTGIMLQPVPVEYMKRTSIAHIHRRLFGFLCRFGYYADMDTVPEPCEILWRMHLDPTMRRATFILEEWKIKDDKQGETFAYKLKLKHPY
jgi:hypothetical protein